SGSPAAERSTGAKPAASPAPAAGRTPAGERTPERAASHWQALQRGTDSGRAAVARAEREEAAGAAPGRAAPGHGVSTTGGTPGTTTADRDPGAPSAGTASEGAEQ
ncbi:hypothetical protein AB0E96_01375, partial [Kitasatospora sp. NPDC036755]